MKTIIYILLGTTALIWTSCSSSESGQIESVQVESETDETTQPTETSGSTPAEAGYTIYGVVQTRPAGKHIYYSMTDAYVDKLDIYEGMPVARGQILYTASSPQLIKLQQDMLEARTNMIWSKNELEKMDTLLQYNAVAGKSLREMQKEYELNRLRYEANKQLLKIIGLPVSAIETGTILTHITARSESDGVVEKVYVSAGAKIGQDQPVTSIINTKNYIVEFMIDRNRAFKLKPGDTLMAKVVSEPAEIALKVSAVSNVTITETNKIRLECIPADPSVKIRYGDAVTAVL